MAQAFSSDDRMIKYLFLLFATLPLVVFSSPAFVSPSKPLISAVSLAMNKEESKPEMACPHPFSQLPGDPSLLLVTNLDLVRNVIYGIHVQCIE